MTIHMIFLGYMQAVNVYWHAKKNLGHILKNNDNVERENAYNLAELEEKLDGIDHKINMLCNKCNNHPFPRSEAVL